MRAENVPATVSPVLTALADTLVPGTPLLPGPPASYPPASLLGVDRAVAELVAGLPAAQRKEFEALLRAVDSRLTNLLLTGRPQRFTRLHRASQEAYLRGWAESRIAMKRRGFQAVKRLTAWFYFSARDVRGRHPLWDRVHYEPPAASTVPSALGLPFGPIVPERDEEVTADVCVVGSGAGGSVIAARLAAAGYRVVVLEAGAWVPAFAYPRDERKGFDGLYLGRGVLTTRDSSIAVLAGETPGGGTSVNWMTCLPPLPEARAEWVSEGGMAGADGAEFDTALRAVSTRMHVSRAESDINPSNDALRRGCLGLGYTQGADWDVIPRNAVGCAQRCGFCPYGCPYGARQSTVTTFLADALSQGARLYCSTRAELVELDGGRPRAVRATYRGPGAQRSLRIRARTVVLAGGAVQTPALLLGSDVKFPGVGVGLRVDPTTAMVGEFPQPVRTWEGPPQTVGVYRFQRTDPGAHGPWLEVAPTHPGLAALATPWKGASDFLRLLERIEFVATPIVLVRDVGAGRVGIDRDGRPVLDYELGGRDRANLLRGLIETARILTAAGATRLLSLNTPYIEVGDGSRAITPNERDRFIAEIEHAGVRTHSSALFSAHPMGSTRAGSDPRGSAARPTGEVHGVEGLWIGDGGLLPTAPGANPMLSILACAWRTADHVISSLSGASRTSVGE